MNDDLEHTVRDSLDRHAAGARPAGGNIDDVYQRADRRHARRRSIAVVGSIAAVVVGIVAFAVLDEPDETLQQAAAPGDDVTTTTSGTAYVCTGYLGSEDVDGSGPREVYSDCVPISWSPSVVETPQCIEPTTIVITTVPMTTITTTTSSTTTTIPVTGTAVGNATAEADVCGLPVLTSPPLCFVTTTMPASTTTVLGPAVGTVPGAGNTTVDAVACGTYSSDTAPRTSGPPPSGPPMTALNCMTSTTTSSSLAPGLTVPSEQQYVVVAGDSLFNIAARYRSDPWIIANYNGWPECVEHPLIVGDVVLIPPGAAIP